jgi:hypothetical protein
MNLCKDCKHSELTVFKDYKCRRHAEVSPVDGITRPRFCDALRMQATSCGPDGKDWEPK